MQEIWKDIRGFENLYQISNLGKVKSLKYGKEKVLRPKRTRGDYLSIGLYKDKKCYTFRIHRLVADTFIPNPLNKEEVNHKNKNKKDNRLINLEWCTRKENIEHRGFVGAKELKELKEKINRAIEYIEHTPNFITFKDSFVAKELLKILK